MSSGQLRRNRWNFPAMNDRGGRRRARRAVKRAQEFCDRMNRAWKAGVMSEPAYRAELGIEPPYSRGGVIQSGEPIRVTFALDECVVAKQDGEWCCRRTDPEHTSTDHHRLFPAALNLNDHYPDLIANLAKGRAE